MSKPIAMSSPPGPPPAPMPSYPGWSSYGPPQHPYGAQPPYGTQRPPHPHWQPRRPLPQHPQATKVVTLGCIAVIGIPFSLGLTALCGPFAWVLGGRAKRSIARNPGLWSGEDVVNLGYILGIVATILMLPFILLATYVLALLAT